jgi:hypothetical protein
VRLSSTPCRIAGLILLCAVAATLVDCSGPPRSSDVPVAASSEDIAERFLEARRRGDSSEMWNCLVGATDRKRVYRGLRRPGDLRTWEEFEGDLDLGWQNPPLAPADVWEMVGERTATSGGMRILLYRQGTDSEPERGLVEIATCPSGSGWLIAWVGKAR